MVLLSYDEACERLNISRKCLENYIKAQEIARKRDGRSFKIDQCELDRFKAMRSKRMVKLNRDDYVKCLDFAVESFYAYKNSGSTADFLGARERGIGKWAEDFVPGKLGEIAFKKFLEGRFQVIVKLDFSINQGGVPAQDIVEFAIPRRGPLAYNPTKLKVSIKTSKMKNIWLAVPENEYESQDRSSDAYVFVRVDLPLNHLARFGRETELFSRLKNIIPEFKDIDAEIVGFAWKEDLEPKPEGIKEASITRPQYALYSGQLKRSDEDWRNFIKKLTMR